jgi:predicted HTH domain antitoxin
MTIMTLHVPESLEKEHEKTVRLIAAKLYEAGKVSLGQAAEMCGLSKRDFPAVLAEFGVNYIQYTYEDIMEDLARIDG